MQGSRAQTALFLPTRAEAEAVAVRVRRARTGIPAPTDLRSDRARIVWNGQDRPTLPANTADWTTGAQMTQAKTLDDLFHDTLKDIYFAVRKILSALPREPAA